MLRRLLILILSVPFICIPGWLYADNDWVATADIGGWYTYWHARDPHRFISKDLNYEPTNNDAHAEYLINPSPIYLLNARLGRDNIFLDFEYVNKKIIDRMVREMPEGKTRDNIEIIKGILYAKGLPYINWTRFKWEIGRFEGIVRFYDIREQTKRRFGEIDFTTTYKTMEWDFDLIGFIQQASTGKVNSQSRFRMPLGFFYKSFKLPTLVYTRMETDGLSDWVGNTVQEIKYQQYSPILGLLYEPVITQDKHSIQELNIELSGFLGYLSTETGKQEKDGYVQGMKSNLGYRYKWILSKVGPMNTLFYINGGLRLDLDQGTTESPNSEDDKRVIGYQNVLFGPYLVIGGGLD
jgi:hypothetical protein